MFVAHIILALGLVIITKQTTFDKSSQGITTMISYTIPAGTTWVKFPGNSISHVPANYFQNLPALNTISLRYNQISTIADYAFNGVPSVTIIELQYNQLDVIRTYMFSGLVNLRELYLYNNHIRTIESGSFRDNIALNILALQENELQNVPRCMFDPENHPAALYPLYLYNNPLKCESSLCWLKRAEGDWITLAYPTSIVCSGPAALSGRTWYSLTEQELECDVTGGHYHMFSHP